MKNGVDPSRLSLATTDDRRFDTPLLDLQEQGYASVMILPSAPVVEVENRHAQLLIAIKGPAIDDSEAMTEMKKEGPLLPMSATLDRRYWQPSESVEDFEEGFGAPDDCNSFLTEGMGSEGADRSRNNVSRMDPTPEEETATTGSLSDQIDPEVKSSGQPPRRQVRFVAEVQIIPSSRTSSDDDDDLTLTNDSEDSDDDGDDDFQDSLNTTAKTILSEWESVEIILSDKVLTSEEPASTKQECADNILTLASSLDPSTVPLPSSPIHEDVETFPSSPILRPSSATSAPLESPVLTPAALTTPSQQPTNPVVSVVTTGLTKTSAAATSNTATTDDCVSPRTLELISVRSQLNYWAETASLLRDQEQALTLHIDQLIQVMADVIEKCQEAEADLHEQKGLVQQLRQELDKERELGFESIQEAALSGREKQLLEIALEESWREIDPLRQQLAALQKQRQQQIGLDEVEEEVQEVLEEQQQPQSIEPFRTGVNKTEDTPFVRAPSFDNLSNCTTTTTTANNHEREEVLFTYSFQSIIKYIFLGFMATFVLLVIGILISGNQHHLHRSFLDVSSASSSSYLAILRRGRILQQHARHAGPLLKSVIHSVRESMPSIPELKALSLSLKTGAVMKGFRLAKTWS
ncbi:hypothetical protein BGX33_008554 [Mortierella sp. NVP41]|nr:hypothetical protein BGX33_008554 [Mortierella sp. NVP41]